MNTVSRRMVYWQIAKSWFFSMIILGVSFTITLLVWIVAVRLAGPVALTLVAMSTLVGLIAFMCSEWLIVRMTNAKRVEQNEYPNLWNIYDEICRACHFRRKPRLYIVDDSVPNAFAFGPGFFGLSGVAVTTRLLTIMSGEQVKGVLGHELGHIAAKDVGLMTIIALVSGAGGQLSAYLIRLRSLQTVLPGILLWICARLLLPIGQKAISRQREKAADAYSAWRCGTPRPLLGALRVLAKGESRITGQKNFLEKLMISHPDTKDRIEALEKYQ